MIINQPINSVTLLQNVITTAVNEACQNGVPAGLAITVLETTKLSTWDIMKEMAKNVPVIVKASSVPLPPVNGERN